MTFEQKYLIPHTIFGELDFEEYCSKIPEFYFKSDVPEDVIKNFEVVEKLLALSYYEYRLIDEAYAKAISTFEMAMSIRYKDFYPDSSRVMFNTLINKLTKLNLFETNFETLNRIREIRNYYAHPERHSFAGIVFWNRVEYISRLINEMYEDVNLRLERQHLFSEFNENLKSSKMDKSVVIEIDGEPTILYSLELLFINNKNTPYTYLFACTPLFDLIPVDGNAVTVPYSFKAKIKDLVFDSNIISGISFSANKRIIFSPIERHKNLLPTFKEWEFNYENSKNKLQYELSMNHYAPKIYTDEIKEFQKK